jgi:hypothetical protein
MGRFGCSLPVTRVIGLFNGKFLTWKEGVEALEQENQVTKEVEKWLYSLVTMA